MGVGVEGSPGEVREDACEAENTRETSLPFALSQWTEAKVSGQRDATKDKQPFPGVPCSAITMGSRHNWSHLITASQRGGQEMALALGAKEGVQRTHR